MARRVVVAMSGGVDSSVAAALLAEGGDEVFGVGLRFPIASAGEDSPCCGMAGMEDARRVAARIGIPFYVLDYQEAFEREVIAPFCSSYLRGETPNPCVRCNLHLKFGSLLDKALALGADYLASGHYARVEHDPGAGRALLRKALDARQDQSYFLYALPVQRLRHLLFPLGTLGKAQVREFARQRDLPVADKPGSQDICFVGEDGYRGLLARVHPEALRPGPIVDRAGRVLGQHRGLAAYTLGQRKGLGIAAEEPLYVLALDVARNAVVAGPRSQTFTRELHVARVNWLAGDPPDAPLRLAVRTRYHGVEAPAEIVPGDGAAVTVRFDEPQSIVAPGQAAVFYDGDLLVGGGVVEPRQGEPS